MHLSKDRFEVSFSIKHTSIPKGNSIIKFVSASSLTEKSPEMIASISLLRSSSIPLLIPILLESTVAVKTKRI